MFFTKVRKSIRQAQRYVEAMLGHDILDALFIYGLVTASYLIMGGDKVDHQAQGAAP